MAKMIIHEVSMNSAEDLDGVLSFIKSLIGGDCGEENADLLSNEVKKEPRSNVRKFRKDAKPSKTDVLLTLRRDLLSVREALLAGDDKDALRRVSFTLDMLENYISEN
jgi:hypothetical protein